MIRKKSSKSITTDPALIILPDPWEDALISRGLSFSRESSFQLVLQFLQLLGLMAVTVLVMPHASFGSG